MTHLLALARKLLALPSRRRKLRARLADALARLPYRGQDEIVIIPLGFGLCSGTKGRV
jgi:hypothetical protein